MNKRPSDQLKDVPPQQKKAKTTCEKHYYPAIPESSDDDESNKRNIALLQEESRQQKPCYETMKSLLIRTHSVRRAEILKSAEVSLSSLIHNNPYLKKCSYVCF